MDVVAAICIHVQFPTLAEHLLCLRFGMNQKPFKLDRGCKKIIGIPVRPRVCENPTCSDSEE